MGKIIIIGEEPTIHQIHQFFPLQNLPTYGTLQTDSCHKLYPWQMICISTQSILMYHSVVKFLKNCRLEFFKMKLQSSISVYMLSDIYTKSSDILNKNTLGVSARLIKCSPNYVWPTALISTEAKKSPTKDVSNYLNDIYNSL